MGSIRFEMYGRTLEAELEDDLVAGHSVGDTPAEFVVGVFLLPNEV